MSYRPSPLVLRGGKLVPRYPENAPEPLSGSASAGDAPLVSEEPPMSGGAKVLVLMFLMSLMIPLSGDLGTLRMTPYTAILLVGFAPWFFSWLGRKKTPIILPDVLVMLFCAWASLAIIYNHGWDNAVQPAGLLWVQTLGAYLLGRLMIRSHRSMRFMVMSVAVLLGLMMPFVIVESVTGEKMILHAFSMLGTTPAEVTADKRFGLSRAQGAFEHPILMGVFCASMVSIVLYSLRSSSKPFFRFIAAPITIISSMASLSTGALLSLNVQFGLMAWGRIFRDNVQRWKMLGMLLAGLYFTVDALSNRTPFHVFVTYATFNQTSSYNRILIWQFGSAEALRHPLFGIGFGEWERPSYMSGSMDNFWLVQAVRFGIPAFLLLASAMVIILRRMGARQLPTEALRMTRQGIMFSLIALSTSIISVHLWNASYVWFCFLMGACVWPIVLPLAQSDALSSPKDAAPIAPAIAPRLKPSAKPRLVRSTARPTPARKVR